MSYCAGTWRKCLRKMPQDEAHMCVVGDLREDLSRIWNSIEVHNLHKFYKEESFTRRQLIKKLAEHFRQDLLILSGTGTASSLVFQSKASNVLKLVVNEDDNDDAAIGKVAKLIVNESKDLKSDKYEYSLQSTHALAILLTQVQHTQSQGDQDNSGTNQIRMMKNEMSEEVLPDVPLQRYRGPHKPEMPADTATKIPLPLKVLVQK